MSEDQINSWIGKVHASDGEGNFGFPISFTEAIRNIPAEEQVEEVTDWQV